MCCLLSDVCSGVVRCVVVDVLLLNGRGLVFVVCLWLCGVDGCRVLLCVECCLWSGDAW